MKIQDIRIKEKIKCKAKFLPMGERILKNTPFELWEHYCFTYADMLLMAFKWDKTREGQKYWQDIFESIEPPNMPSCPKCNNKKVYYKRRFKVYCCIKCKINYDETKTEICAYRPHGSNRAGHTN
jgi:hypothetical protein